MGSTWPSFSPGKAERSQSTGKHEEQSLANLVGSAPSWAGFASDSLAVDQASGSERIELTRTTGTPICTLQDRDLTRHVIGSKKRGGLWCDAEAIPSASCPRTTAG